MDSGYVRAKCSLVDSDMVRFEGTHSVAGCSQQSVYELW